MDESGTFVLFIFLTVFMIDEDNHISYGWDDDPNDKSTETSENDSRPFRPYRSRIFLKEALFFIFDVALNAVIIVGLVFIIRVYLISPFRVFGPSMCDTLNYIDGQCVKDNGEYIIVNKLVYRRFDDFRFGDPGRFDIIVFHPPHKQDDFYIKRVIGLPGDTVKLKDGFVYIYNEQYPDGWKLEENYLSLSNQGRTFPHPRGQSEFTVPQDSYFLLGDNRRFSSDSRHCFTDLGCSVFDSPYLPLSNIAGKAWIVLWPFDLVRFL